jgi:hypothetical protein
VRFELPAGRGRKARPVEQALRAERVELADRQGGKLEVTCLIAAEINARRQQARVLAPPHQPGRPHAGGGGRAARLVSGPLGNRAVLPGAQGGCRVERLQLADTDRLQTALALYMVAWRINRLMRLGRTLPDLPADLVFEADEWRAAFILNKKPVPKTVPPLNTVLRLIAQRGGFLARRHDGEPGAKTIWLGLQEIAVFVEGARYARQFGEGEMCVMGCLMH